MNLSQVKTGDCVKVTEVKGRGKERQHLLDMGVIPGTTVKVIKRAPMGDPLELRLHGYELAVRNSQADKVVVGETSNLYNLSCHNYCENCKHACKSKPSADTEHPGFGEPGRFHNKGNENPLPEDKTITFALVGNPNSGKTTLFNALTGSNQHVGNFPGVTIDRKDGAFKDNKKTNITDLPGIYSFSPYSKEEVVTRNFILKDDCDCIINIIDATSIERSLYLTTQLLQLGHPMVVALNMMDELEENDGSILVNNLEHALGVPIVPISATKGEGLDELVDHAIHIAKYQELPLKQDFCEADSPVHRALHSIMHMIEDHSMKSNIPVRFAAEKIAENDHLVMDDLKLNDEDKKAIEHILKHMEEVSQIDRSALIADMRYRYIIKVCSECVIKGKPSVQRKRTELADKILTGKFTGIPMFVLIMAFVFWLTFGVIGKFLQEMFALGIDNLSNICEHAMVSAGVNEVVQSLITNALFKGVGSVVSFLPIIVVLFFFLSILEDSGYMARVAFVMDKLLRKIGLSGRSIVPLLIGFGCSVPAIMATRTIPSERDRKLTILLTPYMSCSAKLPIYAFLSVAFFPQCAALVMIAMYFLGIVIGIIVALFMKGKGKPVPFIMELPNYRLPSLKNVGQLMWEKCKDFLSRAFTVILIATVIIWFLQSFDMSLNLVMDSQNSILAQIAGFISPVFAPIGLGDWKIVTSLISGFMAKESVVATISILYGGASQIAAVLTPLMGLSFLVFCLLYTPCIAAIVSVKRELGLKYALLVILAQCLIAWIVCFLVVTIGSLL